MKKLIFLFLIFPFLSYKSYTQVETTKFTFENLEDKIFTYQPIQRKGVSDEKFSKGNYILNDIKEVVANDNNEFTYSDYWNIAMVFISHGEPKEHIEIAFQKAIFDNAESICQYVDAYGEPAVTRFTKLIPELFLPFYENCSKFEQKEEQLNCKKYSAERNLDLELVELISKVGEDDQKYRKMKKVDWSKQTVLDKRNLGIIDSLFKKYGRYIGKDLVGEKLEAVMWAVIQHSNVEVMERYLPIIHQAVEAGNIHQTPFKMLLDRIYCAKYNYQFFGSQFGGDCKLADEEKKLSIQKKYHLE